MRPIPGPVVLFGILVILAGCASPAIESSSPSTTGAPTHTPQTLLVAVLNRTFANPVPPPPPTASSDEFVMGNVTVPDGASNVTFAFHRHHRSAELFAANCRVYLGAKLVSQKAFSDAQYGNLDSSGDCVAGATEPGDYLVVYLADKQDPQGTHEVSVRVTATI
ncbi:MAG: hypothetical protein V4510_12585 [bacterium]